MQEAGHDGLCPMCTALWHSAGELWQEVATGAADASTEQNEPAAAKPAGIGQPVKKRRRRSRRGKRLQETRTASTGE